MPVTARAYVLEHFGHDGLVERLRTVADPGPGEVLVRMTAASLNFRDLKILKGVYGNSVTLPVVPLSDGAGVVAAAGPDRGRFRPGDRVMPIYWEGWHTGPLSTRNDSWKSKSAEVDGVAVEYAVYREADLVAIPEALSDEEAACLPCAGVTAWHALVAVGHVKPGDTVLVMGSGGVSVFGLQIARMSGARVIALSSNDAKLERLRDLGAADGVNYRKVQDWQEAVRVATMGRGVDLVLEVGGAGTVQRSIRATKDGGHVTSVGNLTGSFAASAAVERAVRVTKVSVGSREMAEDLTRAIALNRQMPVIDRSFAFSRLRDALAYLDSGRHFGKVVITF
jgi:NADPH:quinone reductase-like Zn-dependent oxidoreductase